MYPARCTLVLVAALVTIVVTAQSPLDSLLKVLPSQNGAERVKTLGDVQWELGFTDPAKAAQYGTEALRIAELTGDSSVIASAVNDMAVTEYRLGHYQRSIDLNVRALLIREVLRDSAGMAASHSKLGVAYTELLAFDSALRHDYAAERIYVARGELVRAAQVRGNLGRLYQQEGDLETAERVARETVTMLDGKNEPYAEAAALGQLAHILVDRKDMDGTLETAQRAVALFRQLDAKAEIASLANILGLAYRKKGDDVNGLKYYREALDLSQAIGDLNGEAVYLANVANVLADGGHLSEALPLYEASIAICRREDYPDQLMTSLDGYVSALDRSGRQRDALPVLRELLALRDSLYKTERIAALSDMQVKYETQRTEKELLEERQRTLEQQARIDRQRFWIGIISASVLVLALISWLVILRQRTRARGERDAAVIAEREQGLKVLVESTDAERARISAELHDGVGQLLTGLKFRMEAAATDRPELNEVRALADDAAREVRGIAHRMMPRALGDLGLVPALTDMLDKSLKLPGKHHTFEHFGLEQRLPTHIETGVYRIAQELVSNIIKHAQARNVQVELLRNKGHLVLIVEDDGTGIDPARASGGLGLRSMQDRARVLHGAIDIGPGPGRGTIATLRVPLTNGEAT
jgi:two-component system NarL family sensor kinase